MLTLAMLGGQRFGSRLLPWLFAVALAVLDLGPNFLPERGKKAEQLPCTLHTWSAGAFPRSSPKHQIQIKRNKWLLKASILVLLGHEDGVP